jgi:hypothetical protein
MTTRNTALWGVRHCSLADKYQCCGRRYSMGSSYGLGGPGLESRYWLQNFFSSQKRPDPFRAHQISYSKSTGVLSFGSKTSRGVTLATHFHLVSRLIMSGAILILPLYDFIAWRRKILPFACVPKFEKTVTVIKYCGKFINRFLFMCSSRHWKLSFIGWRTVSRTVLMWCWEILDKLHRLASVV